MARERVNVPSDRVAAFLMSQAGKLARARAEGRLLGELCPGRSTSQEARAFAIRLLNDRESDLRGYVREFPVGGTWALWEKRAADIFDEELRRTGCPR